MSNEFRIDSNELMNNLEQANIKMQAAVAIYAETQAKNLESYAKQNRPWTDRTGDARKRLSGYTSNIPNGIRINLAHGVDYGIWLELAHEKRYAILEPTVRLKGQEVVDGMTTLLNAFGGMNK